MPSVHQHLSPRQRAILALAANGLSNDEIARQLSIHEQSVKTQFLRIYRRLGVRQARQQAIWLFLEGGAR